MRSEYGRLGVDVTKKGIAVFKGLTDNLFPDAFCVVTSDPNDATRGLVLHTDSAGTKPVQAYVNWRETGDIDAFRGLAQDVIAMNVDDVVCVGASPVSFVDYIAVNPFNVSKPAVLATLAKGFEATFHLLKRYGLDIHFGGGETADVPDLVRVLDLSGTALGCVAIDDVVSGANVEEGDRIIGLRSGGKTYLEKTLNSGIMCNGITLARRCLMRRDYAVRYPEIEEPRAGPYSGEYNADTYVDELEMTVGDAITSPTRLYTPLILEILREHRPAVKALVHNTGGGQTKCLGVGSGIHYLKDDPLPVDPIFHLIQQASKEEWRAMFQDYNMGTGFEIVVQATAADDVVDACDRYGIEAKVIGRCHRTGRDNSVTLQTRWGTFHYS
jgi:phosphoribosylformylglycinamidine cyclo-ligase